jgi:serine/threonine-protein kinase
LAEPGAAMIDLVFGKYEILRRIAVGGMGEVFLARQVGVSGFERPTILKSMLPAYAAHADFIEQFLDEARIAATLNHPNVVAIHEVGQWKGTYYLAMEYIEGMDLSQLLSATRQVGKPLPPLLAARIVLDAAQGLAHAHLATDARGRPLHLVHRDVSPHNLMLRRDGQTKVVDFGVARANNRVARTATGLIKGKLVYMSPEQAQGETLDAQSDQYSLGLVLWELLAGRRMVQASGDLDVLKEVVIGKIFAPSTVRPDVPDWLDEVVLRMLKRDPARRFASCAEVAKALAAGIRSTPDVDHRAVEQFVRELVECLPDNSPSLTPDFVEVLRARSEGASPPYERPADALPRAKPPKRASPVAFSWRSLAAIFVTFALATAGGLAWLRSQRVPMNTPTLSAHDEFATIVTPPTAAEANPPEVEPGSVTAGPNPPASETGSATAEPHPPLVRPGSVTAGLNPPAARPGDAAAGAPARGVGREKRATSFGATDSAPHRSTSAGSVAKASRSIAADAFLSVSTEPWSKVSLDGKFVGSTPLFKIKVPSGKRELLLVNDAAGVRERRVVELVPGETLKLTLSLTPSRPQPNSN